MTGGDQAQCAPAPGLEGLLSKYRQVLVVASLPAKLLSVLQGAWIDGLSVRLDQQTSLGWLIYWEAVGKERLPASWEPKSLRCRVCVPTWWLLAGSSGSGVFRAWSLAFPSLPLLMVTPTCFPPFCRPGPGGLKLCFTIQLKCGLLFGCSL